MTFRKLIFWPHLIAGCLAGVVVLIMSVTGTLLMYEKQIVAWADEREYRSGPPAQDAARLPIDSLINAAHQSKNALPSMVTLRSDPEAPALLSYGREGALYVNPYTGAILGSGSPKVREFFHAVTDWHRWLGAEGASRSTSRAITGASNLAFLFLIVSGFYLWMPKRWTWKHLKPITLFRGGLAGKARDFNWHNVFGLWCAVPLFFVVLGAVVISYPWASNLAYRMAGSEPPKQQGPPRGGAQGRVVMVDGLQSAWDAAQTAVSDWRTITLRLPPSERVPLLFTVDRGYGGQPQKRTTLTVNRLTAKVEKSENFANLDSGRQFRTWLRFVHTGEYYGLTGQTVAGIASAGGAFLVWTGIALALRRFRSWRARKKSAAETLVGAA
jgi:uncharacterized iron-regulated membrane protein